MKKALAPKILSVTLTAAMALTASACGVSTSTGGGDESTSTTLTTTSSSAVSDSSASASGTATSETSNQEPVTISLYTTIPGHDDDFEALCKEFMQQNPNITVNYIAYDSSEKQKWMTLYASGEAPTVSVMDPIDIQDNVDNMVEFDPTADTWMSNVDSKYLDVFKSNGKVYGIPNSVQAMGITYNKTTIEKATGETFDPSTIKSTSDLEKLCEKIKAGGVSPIMFTGVDWSLGSHYLSQVFSGVRGDASAQEEFISGLKSGQTELKSDPVWNSVMNTFDVIAKYNYNAKDPLVGDTEVDGQAMASGKVAMWFMGDWSWSYLSATANSSDEYGIMPCPLTDNESDEINQELGVFPSKGYCVDKSQNDEAQQAAGKKLVQFLCFGDQQGMADLLQTALPYLNCNVTYSNPITQSTQSYIASSKTASTYAFSMLLPSDFWSENGATMQQYLAGKINRDKAADTIQKYWESQK